MKTALNFSLINSFLKKSEYELIINHMNNISLPFSINNFFGLKDLNRILSFMTKDKKNNSSKINLVLLKKIGLPIINKKYSKKNISLFLKTYLRN